MKHKIKVLYIGVSPKNNPIDVQSERQHIETKCKAFKNYCEFKSLINPLFEEIVTNLENYKPNILHFGMHGHPEEGVDLFRDTNGETHRVPSENFRLIISKISKPIELLILSSCYGIHFSNETINHPKIMAEISFQGKVEDKSMLCYADVLYHEILSAEKVKKAVQVANDCLKEKQSTFIVNPKHIHTPNDYALRDKSQEALQANRKIEGATLLERLGSDDLGDVWYVHEGSDKNGIRRFLEKSIDANTQAQVVTAIRDVKTLLAKTRGVLIPIQDLNCPNPYIRYESENKITWKSIKNLCEEDLQYPLGREEIAEVNSIILQLAKLIREAHAKGDNGQGVIHGRLNPECILVVDKNNNESSTFGNLTPLITDFGLWDLTDRTYRHVNKHFTFSKWVKNGKKPRKFDDIYAITAIWFRMLSGQDPHQTNINNVQSWNQLFKHGISQDIQMIISEIINHDSDIEQTSFLKNIIEILTDIVPDDQWDLYTQKVDPVTNSIGMTFTVIGERSHQSFEYTVGSSNNDSNAEKNEKPKRLISLNSYCISQCVMSIQNLIDVADKSQDNDLKIAVAEFKKLSPEERELPATTIYQDGIEQKISWQFAKKLCDTMTKLSGEVSAHGFKYRLPTEAEWEVACRASTTTSFNTGHDNLTQHNANFEGHELKPVKSYQPNSLQLYQMHGNVWEFCEDYYGEYNINDKKNPKGQQVEFQKLGRLFGKRHAKVIRGGDFRTNMKNCRSAKRAFIEDNGDAANELHTPDENQIVGIRLVCLTLSQQN